MSLIPLPSKPTCYQIASMVEFEETIRTSDKKLVIIDVYKEWSDPNTEYLYLQVWKDIEEAAERIHLVSFPTETPQMLSQLRTLVPAIEFGNRSTRPLFLFVKNRRVVHADGFNQIPYMHLHLT